MDWHNSIKDTLHPPRATARQINLDPPMWWVVYRNADYTVSRCAEGWKVRGRGGLLHIVPDSDSGKEGAIDWIEWNC